MATYNVSTAFKGIDGVSKMFRGMGRASDKFRKKSTNNFKAASRSGSMFGSVLGGNLAANAITGGARLIQSGLAGIVREASKIEDATAAFTPLMGNTKKAELLVARLNKEAASTPFQFENIAGVAKQLLPVLGDDINAVADTFRMLGDTAGGNAQKLETITRGFTKALLKGKPDLESLNMIGEAGVPIFTEMAKGMGISVQQLLELSKKGKLTNKDLTKTFENMTSKGGLFYKGMEIASETVTGKMSTLKDNISLTAGAIGLKLFPTIKKVADQLILVAGNVRKWFDANSDLVNQKINKFIDSVVSGFQKALPYLKAFVSFIKIMLPIVIKLAPVFLIWKASIIAVNLALSGMAILGTIGKFLQFIKIVFMMAKAKGVWAAAQWALNVALNANPIGLIVIGVVALIGVIILVVKHWNFLKEAITGVNTKYRALSNIIAVLLGPIGIMVKIIVTMVSAFNAFKNNGFISGIKAIGLALFDFLISPLELILNLMTKIPGFKTIGNAGLDGIDSLREKLSVEQQPITNEGAPNQAKEDGRRGIGGNANINIKTEGPVSAEEEGNSLQGVNLAFAGQN